MDRQPYDHVLFSHLTRDELARVAETGLVVLPTGATEQHGPHLPSGTDSFHVEHVALSAALRIADEVPIAVAPTLPFGMSQHHLPFGATLSVDSTTYLSFLLSLGLSLSQWDVSRLFILNGHGGNHELVQVAARELVLQTGMKVASGSWWNIAYDRLVAEGALQVGKLPGHSGGFETSIMLALDDAAVRRPLPHRDDHEASHPARFQGLWRPELPDAWTEIDGYTDSPDLADSDLGERLLSAAVDEVSSVLKRFNTAE